MLSPASESIASSSSGVKVLDNFDIELISTRISLLKIDFIFECTGQSRAEIVEQSEQHLKTQSRRAELDSTYYT